MSEISTGAGEQSPAQLAVAGIQPSYEQIRALEAAMLASGQTIDPPVSHHWADGVYGREVHLKAGDVVTGKIHRFSTLNILLSGEVSITTAEGIKRLVAPAIFTTEPGTKKVCHAHTDARFLNIHATKLTDVSAIEAKFIVPEAPHALQEDRPCLGLQQV